MMQRKSRRVLAWLLALTLVLSLFPATALAADACICDVLCCTENVNAGCPVCKDTPENCTPARPVCDCAALCTEGSVKTDCPVCGAEGADLSACTGMAEEAPTEEPTAQKVITGFLDMPPSSSLELLVGKTPEIPDALSANVEGQADAEAVPVTWASEPEFNPNAEGKYVFTSALADADAYVLDGVAMPTVTVTVVAKSSQEPPGLYTTYNNAKITQLTRNNSGQITSVTVSFDTSDTANSQWFLAIHAEAPSGTISGNSSSDVSNFSNYPHSSPVTTGNGTHTMAISIPSGVPTTHTVALWIYYNGSWTCDKTWSLATLVNAWSGYSVALTSPPNSHLTVTSGSLTQTSVTSAITPIVLTAAAGYELTIPFIASLNGVLNNSGLSAAQTANGTVTISGTPTKNVSGTLPVATARDQYVSSTGDDTNGDGTETKPYATLNHAHSQAESGSTIHVMDNLTLTEGVTLDQNKAVTIQGVKTGSVVPTVTVPDTITAFTISGTGTATFQDITLEGQGKEKTDRKLPFLELKGGSSVTLGDGATIQKAGMAGTGSTGDKYGLVVISGGTFTMENGSAVKDCSALSGCIRLDNANAKFLMKGGTIENCDSRYTEKEGSAVYINQGGSMEMSGGTITGCGKETGSLMNGTVFLNVNSANKFTMSGGTITGNQADLGGGIYSKGGTITLSGNPHIRGNVSTNASVAGESNIYLLENQTVTIGSSHLSSGADIGVYAAGTIDASSDVKVATAANSSDAKFFHSDNASAAGVLFCDGSADDGGHHAHESGNANTLWLSTAARTILELYVDAGSNGSDASTQPGTKDKPLKTLVEALKRISTGGTIKLLSDVDFDSVYSKLIPESNGKDVTITSDPDQPSSTYTINCVGATGEWKTYAQFYVSGGSSLTLKNVTVDGNAASRKTDGDYSVYGDFFIGPTTAAIQSGKHTSLILEDGATLQNFYPRAVNIRAGGTLTMKPGSKIQNCEAGINGWFGYDKYNGTDGVGAAVYVCPDGTFDMRGGTITGNKANGYTGDSDGGPETVQNQPTTTSSVSVTGGVAGVFGENGATFKMSGAPVVTGNTFNGVAANVYLNDGATIQLTGEITSGANVGVYVDPMPSLSNRQVTIAVGGTESGAYQPKDTDADGFHSDKATQAGVNYLSGSHTIVLDYDKRSANGGVDGNGEGFVKVSVSPNTGYAVLDEEGNAIPGLKAYDKNGAEITNPTNGWYTTTNGPITFRPILAGSHPTVVSNPMSTANDAKPTDKTDGTGVSIPAVNEKQLSAEIKGEPKKASITVEPADPNLQYGLVDKDGNAVSPAGDWKDVVNGKVVFDGLEPGKEYKVVAKPKTDSTSTTTNKKGTGVGVKTPADTFKDVTADDVSRDHSDTPDKDKIVLKPTNTDQQYAVIDKATGEVVTDSNGAPIWKNGAGADADLVFDNLDPTKDYEVVTRTPGTPASLPGKGVDVPSETVKSDQVQTGTDPNGKASITVDNTDPNTKYAVVDRNTGKVVSPIGSDADGWLTGNNGTLTFPGLNAGGDYKVVTYPKDAAKDQDATNPATNTPGNPYPTDGNLVGPSVKIPTVSPDQLTGSVAGTDSDNNGKKDASITIQPADPDLSYAVVDKDGNVVGGAEGWKTPGADGSVTFSPLDPNTKYEVVALPKNTADKPTTGESGKGTAITTPAEKKAEENAIDRNTNVGGTNDGKDKIVVGSTAPNLDYAIVDPATGKVVAPVATGSGTDDDGWQTGNSGQLTFDGLTPGKAYEVVTRPHVTDGSIPVANRPGVTVGKSGILNASGIVKDASGPVAGATVKVTVATTDGGYQTLKATTDANGRYTLEGTNILLPNDYTIYVDSGKGVAGSTQTFNKSQPQALTDITVAKAASGNTNIAGGAVSDAGKPVANQSIVVRNKADGSVVTPGTGSVTTTTKGGGYTVEDLPDGTYIVEATTSDGKSGMTEIKVSGGKITANDVGGYTNSNIPVTPGGILSGKVSGLKAGEKAPVTINVPLYDEAGTVIGSKTVSGVAEGPGGYWQIAGVPAGTYPVTVETPNGTITGTATVGSNGTVSGATTGEGAPANSIKAESGKLNITAPAAKPDKPSAVTGIVTDQDGKPITNATVGIYNEKGEKVGTATTGEGGGYTVPNNLPDGNYYITADQGGKNGLTGPVKITGGKTEGKTNVTLPKDAGKLLEGAVTKEGGTTPASNAMVVVKDKDGNVIATTKTNGSGQYFVGSVPANATVSIVTTDGETKSFTVGTTTSEGAYDGDATTAKPAAGAKPVIGPNGGKLPIVIGGNGTTETKVTVTGPTPATDNVNSKFEVVDGNLTAKTDANKPAAGTYTVTVEQNGMKVQQNITVNASGAITDSNPIVIAPHTVTGYVKYGTGVVPSDASISVPGWGEARVNTRDGKYTLTGIPDGSYPAKIKVTDSNKSAPDNVSEINVTLEVKDGVATYKTPQTSSTGASVTPSGTNLTVTPTTAVNGIAGKVSAAKSAVDAAKSDPTKVADAIAKVKAAQDAINGATEEELKQLDKNATQALADALASLLTGELDVKADAAGMTNASEAKNALTSQKGLLVEETELKAAAEAQKTVEVSLTLKAEDVTSEPTSAVNKDIPKVEAAASAAGAEKTALYEIVVEKTTVVKQDGNPISETTSNVPVLPAPITLTLTIPQNLRGYQYYGVVRVHDGKAENIPSKATADTITITSNLYSTYAILASNDPIFPDDLKVETDTPVTPPPVNPGNPGGTGGGGGGGSSSSDTVNIGKTEHGKVSVDKSSASKGQTVIITVTPDKGYELGSLTVTDKNGNELKLKDLGDNKYSYVQPSAQPVTIKATFEKVSGEDPDYASCPKDETCPIYKFTDASTTAWYHDGVHYCVDNGLMNGTSATTFAPNSTTTRAMIVTILYRLEGTPKTSGSSYPDVTAGQYYTDAVAWASANGIVNGYTNGNFGPNDPITREQMAAILYRYAGFKGYDVSAKADLSKFSDSAQVSGYAVEPLSWANAEGLVTGKGEGILDPRGFATRAQVATILMRFCVNIAER